MFKLLELGHCGWYAKTCLCLQSEDGDPRVTPTPKPEISSQILKSQTYVKELHGDVEADQPVLASLLSPPAPGSTTVTALIEKNKEETNFDVTQVKSAKYCPLFCQKN